jgi:phosphohistidine phosphatase
MLAGAATVRTGRAAVAAGSRSRRPARDTRRAPWQDAGAMRQLLLLRHAKSSWDDPSLPDHARPLNARGRRAAVAMAAAMRDLGLAPDVVLVSSARRTLQTLEAISPFAESPLVEPMDDLYLAPWPRLLEALRRAPETARSVMMIGHNPGLHDLALALVGAAGMATGSASARRMAEGFPTCALAEFVVATPWQELGEGGGRLVRFLAPADLPEMAL